MGAQKVVFEHYREAVIAHHLFEAGKNISWANFRSPSEKISQWKTAFGRQFLIVWKDVPTTDMGFYPDMIEVDFTISDVLPVLPWNDVWIGTRMRFEYVY